MPRRISTALVPLLLAAAAPCFAQDFYEPNPSLARLSSDGDFARASARSLKAARILAPAAIRIDAAGRIVVAGVDLLGDEPTAEGAAYLPRVARLLADGSLDPAFGEDGVAAIPVWAPAGGPVFLGLEIDAAGRIVVTGEFRPPDTAYGVGQAYGAARLAADGTLDASFSGDGLLELDPAAPASWNPGAFYAGLGSVHASGTGGAMIAAAHKVGPQTTDLAGFVRIAPDGTIDASYAGGFASLGRVRLEDFAVDAAGRVVASAVDDLDYAGTSLTNGVSRLDAAGAFDLSFGTNGRLTAAGGGLVSAGRIAFDRQNRIVTYGAGFDRYLADGAPDLSFSGDGHALHTATGFDGGARGGAEFLAVAAGADRYALAGGLRYRGRAGHDVAWGLGVQSIDPASPGAIASYGTRAPRGRYADVAALAVTPDGETAYALGFAPDSVVLRVDLTGGKTLALPDLRVRWVGYVRAIDFGGGNYRVTGRIRVTNKGRRAVTRAQVGVGGGDHGNAALAPFALRPRRSVVLKYSQEASLGSVDLAGVRMRAAVSSELPETNLGDNVADSPPITPVWLPR